MIRSILVAHHDEYIANDSLRIARKLNSRRWIFAVVVIIVVMLALSLTFYYYYQISSSKAIITSEPEIHRYVTEYPVGKNSSPNGVAVDSRGNVWFVLENNTALAELTPSNGTFKQYPLPEPKSTQVYAWGVTVDNTRGLVWFTDGISNTVWSFNISNHAFTRYQVPTKDAFPFEIALDAEGNAWFTEIFENKIGEVTIGGTLQEFQIPTTGNISNTEPSGITVDKVGRVWFTESTTDSIGSYYDGKFQTYNLSRLLNSPVGIAIDSKGNLWITQHGPSFISEFNPFTHYFRTISTSIPALNTSLPYFVYVDSHDNVWFNEHYGNAIARFSPANNTLVEYEAPSKIPSMGNISGILTMALSPDGQPWFTELFTGKIGTINVSHPLEVELNTGATLQSVVNISNGSTATFPISVSSVGSTVLMKSSISNYTSKFTLSFNPSSGEGSFTSNLIIENRGSEAGIYFVTLSAASNDLIVSGVVEISTE